MTATTDLNALYDQAQNSSEKAAKTTQKRIRELQTAEDKLAQAEDRIATLKAEPGQVAIEALVEANATAELAEAQVGISRKSYLHSQAEESVAIGKRKQTETVLLNTAITEQLEHIERTVQTAIDDLAFQAEELRRLEDRRRSLSLKQAPYYGIPRLDGLKNWLSARDKWETRKARDAAVPDGGYRVRLTDIRDDPIKNESRTQEFGPALHIPRGGSVEARIPADMLRRLQRRTDLEVQLLELEDQVAD